ncbi:hypothetical protein [Halomonas sp. KO116]|uniref:hypothetical protein n=1 Tax=Halomonas sp. KO116 TaxID=1504981 RepID=UPI0004E3B86C|nr:hypothetical protein [Halomonas sp. KO116]AJY53277.1 hypothetical protein KO116_P200170 [Halomonas sp. KO116]
MYHALPWQSLKRLVGVSTLALMPLMASAQTVTLSDAYVLHDNDTLSIARALLADRIIQEAVKQNGQYVAIEQTLTQDGFAGESIHVLNSGLVEVLDTREQVATNEHGRMVLTLEKTLQLDPDSLQRRIEALHTNHEQAVALRQLATENQRLREQRGILMDHQRFGDPVARAQAFERWRHELANWEQRSVSLEQIAQAQEALVTNTQDPLQLRDALHYRLVQAGRQLEAQLKPEITNQTVVGEHLELEIRVTGLRNAAALIRDALGFPLANDGLLYPGDYRQWPQDQRNQLRQVLPVLAMLPIYLTVEAGHERNTFGGFEKTTRRGYFDGRYAGQSHLLFGTMMYAPGKGLNSVRQMPIHAAMANDLATDDYFATDTTGFAGSTGRRLTLGLMPSSPQHTSRYVTVEDADTIRVLLKLKADRGIPPYILARVAVGGWDHYESQDRL